jgi:DNA transformation protein and related proteins
VARASRSLKVSDAFKAFVLDQLDELGDVTPKSMFGGVGFYCNGVFFAIAARDRLYFKVDASSQPQYVAARMKPFRPFPGRRGSMRYYEVPLEVLEIPGELVAWARRAVAAART